MRVQLFALALILAGCRATDDSQQATARPTAQPTSQDLGTGGIAVLVESTPDHDATHVRRALGQLVTDSKHRPALLERSVVWAKDARLAGFNCAPEDATCVSFVGELLAVDHVLTLDLRPVAGGAYEGTVRLHNVKPSRVTLTSTPVAIPADGLSAAHAAATASTLLAAMPTGGNHKKPDARVDGDAVLAQRVRTLTPILAKCDLPCASLWTRMLSEREPDSAEAVEYTVVKCAAQCSMAPATAESVARWRAKALSALEQCADPCARYITAPTGLSATTPELLLENAVVGYVIDQCMARCAQ